MATNANPPRTVTPARAGKVLDFDRDSANDHGEHHQQHGLKQHHDHPERHVGPNQRPGRQGGGRETAEDPAFAQRHHGYGAEYAAVHHAHGNQARHDEVDHLQAL